jgi:Zn-dependent membrane protease YugP
MWSNVADKQSITGPETVKVSKWTDANGVVHYENRLVEGAKTIEVDPNKNVLPPAPVVKLPETKTAKPKTANEEVEALQKAKDAYVESIINN